MGVKPREAVLVIADPARLRVAEALVKAAQDVGAEGHLELVGFTSKRKRVLLER